MFGTSNAQRAAFKDDEEKALRHAASIAAASHKQAAAAKRLQARPAKCFFSSFRALEGMPPDAPSATEALAFLHRLAEDSSIVAIMELHGWEVGQ